MCSDFYLKDSGALKKNEMKNGKVKKKVGRKDRRKD